VKRSLTIRLILILLRRYRVAAWVRAHLLKWGIVELKYLALLVAGEAALGIGFFNGESFEWKDWAIITCKMAETWATVTFAFIDRSYGQAKDG